MSAVIALLLMQIAPGEFKNYAKDSEFSVLGGEGDCLLSADYENDVNTSISISAEGDVYFILRKDDWKPVARKRYELKIKFDDVSNDFNTVAIENGSLGGPVHPSFLDIYAKSSSLDILWGSKQIAALKLAGSLKAIDALRLCLKENGITLSDPSAPAIVPSQIISDPFDMSQVAKIRNYFGNGYPVEANGAEGTVKAAVKVSASGRALECNVVETSGSTILDEVACKTLRQSSFIAAKDRAGQAIESVIELPLRFEDPSKTVQPN